MSTASTTNAAVSSTRAEVPVQRSQMAWREGLPRSESASSEAIHAPARALSVPRPAHARGAPVTVGERRCSWPDRPLSMALQCHWCGQEDDVVRDCPKWNQPGPRANSGGAGMGGKSQSETTECERNRRLERLQRGERPEAFAAGAAQRARRATEVGQRPLARVNDAEHRERYSARGARRETLALLACPLRGPSRATSRPLSLFQAPGDWNWGPCRV